MKIHYFREGIKDDSFNPVKTTILVDRSMFSDYNSVMNLYSNFKRLQKNDIVPQGHTISALTQGCGGGGQGCGSFGHGRGRGGNLRSSRLVPQEEVKKVTDVEAKRYPTNVYSTFTPAQKAKHWQLLHPEQTPGSRPTKNSRNGTGATASGLTNSIAEFKTDVSSAATAILNFTDATNTQSDDKESDMTRDSRWGRPSGDNCDNRNNPALACQDPGKKSKNNN